MSKQKKRGGALLITHSDPRSPAAEAYRTLRTNIQFSSLDKPIRTLLITGPNPDCGKSTTAANLGVALAQAGSTVLLVDSDLRRPTLHKFFGFFNDQGLTSLLVDVTKDLNTAVHRTHLENLHLLPSGPLPPNPAEMLATEKMRSMVGVFASAYDYVVFDSPPVIAVTDAAILSRLADAAILVLDYGTVTRDEAVFALEQLRKVGANVIGSVINNIPNNKNHYYYYYYGEKAASRKKRKKPSRSGRGDFSIPG